MILDGSLLAKKIKKNIKEEIKDIGGRKPGLAVIIVGDDSRSMVYVRNKEKSAKKMGFLSEVIHFPDNTPEDTIKDKIRDLNNDEKIDGILLQIPLPDGYNEAEITNIIDPRKDVDGLHPFSLGNLIKGNDGHIPCTPHGIIRLLDEYDIEIKSKRVLIIGRSNIVGKPLFHLFLKRHGTITVAHTKTLDMKKLMYEADIVVSAVGKPFLIGKEDVRKDAVLIDVGINTLSRKEYMQYKDNIDEKREKDFEKKGYTIVGDIDYDELVNEVAYITPVPGGVGPLTVAMLMQNTLNSYKKRI